MTNIQKVEVKRKEEPEWYKQLVIDLKKLAFEGIVKTKWLIGKRILKEKLKFKKPKYGSKTIENLAKDLNTSKDDIYGCINFARKYPKLSDISDNWSWWYIRHKLLPKPKPDKPEDTSFPEGIFNVIYADPPWKYGDKCEEGGVQHRGAEKIYPVLSINELCNYVDKDGKKVQELFTENAVLFLWVTSPLLAECFEVIKAWGFVYKASFVWDKDKHNRGHYNSVRHEFLLIATKGSFLPDHKKLYDSVQTIKRTKHSKKPEEFRQIIEDIYRKGKRPYLELFGRGKAPEGWIFWGLEALNE